MTEHKHKFSAPFETEFCEPCRVFGSFAPRTATRLPICTRCGSNTPLVIVVRECDCGRIERKRGGFQPTKGDYVPTTWERV